MKATVITVCYNAARTLADTLESVARQDEALVEHIVVDGGSTDATAEVVAEHGGHVAKFVSEPDRGIYDAMNKGLAMAGGDVIAFLNADDVYAHDQVITDVVAAMQADDLDALFGDVAFFRPEAPDRSVRRYRADRFHPSRLAWGWMPAHPASFVRRRMFERVGGFKSDYSIAGDFEFFVRLFRRSQVNYCHVPAVLVHMRIGGISTSGWRNTVRLNREVLRACRENGIDTNMPKILSKYPMKLLELLMR